MPLRRSVFASLLHRHPVAALAGAFAVGAAASAAIAQGTAQQTQRYPQFENGDVKVWKSVVMPNAPLTMHRHDHGRVIIALRGGTMKIVERSGATEAHVWETAKAYWLGPNTPGTEHADVNAGDQPIEVMVVELKKDQ
jgi:hypothetical protein